MSGKRFLSGIILLVLLSFSLVVSVEAYVTMWNQTYGGTGYESVSSLVATSDGGYAVAGGINSDGNDDFWLVKTDAIGNMQWSKTYGGIQPDVASSLVEVSDGGYAIAGYTMSFGAGHEDFWLIKTDVNGNMEWNQTYGGPGQEKVHSLIETSDGGYAIVGNKYTFTVEGNHCWFVKTDKSGSMLWNQTYSGTYSTYGMSVVETIDGGYAIAGFKSHGAGNTDYWLIKTDASGNVEWNRTYGGPKEEQVWSLIMTSDGGYALVGTARSLTGTGGAPNATTGDFWLVKTDSSGNMEWNKTYGGPYSEWASSLVEAADGGYVIAGDTQSFGAGHEDIWLVKTDVNGNVEWNQTYGGPETDRAWALVKTSDEEYAIAGLTKSFGESIGDMWLIKIGPNLSTYEFKMTFEETPYNVFVLSNSTIGDYTLDYEQKQISFNVSGSTGTTGFCNVSIPKDLLEGEFSVHFSGEPLVKGVTYTLKQTDTHYIITLTYHHSSHTITITGTKMIPEFSSWILPSLLLTATLFIVYAKKKLEQSKKPCDVE